MPNASRVIVRRAAAAALWAVIALILASLWSPTVGVRASSGVSIDPTSGPVGTRIHFHADGVVPGGHYCLYVDGHPFADLGKADSTTFDTEYTIPDLPVGPHTGTFVYCAYPDTVLATVVFTITPGPTPGEKTSYAHEVIVPMVAKD